MWAPCIAYSSRSLGNMNPPVGPWAPVCLSERAQRLPRTWSRPLLACTRFWSSPAARRSTTPPLWYIINSPNGVVCCTFAFGRGQTSKTGHNFKNPMLNSCVSSRRGAAQQNFNTPLAANLHFKRGKFTFQGCSEFSATLKTEEHVARGSQDAIADTLKSAEPLESVISRIEDMAAANGSVKSYSFFYSLTKKEVSVHRFDCLFQLVFQTNLPRLLPCPLPVHVRGVQRNKERCSCWPLPWKADVHCVGASIMGRPKSSSNLNGEVVGQELQ